MSGGKDLELENECELFAYCNCACDEYTWASWVKMRKGFCVIAVGWAALDRRKRNNASLPLSDYSWSFFRFSRKRKNDEIGKWLMVVMCEQSSKANLSGSAGWPWLWPSFSFRLHSHTHANNIITVGLGYGHERTEKMLIRMIAGNNEKRRKTVVPFLRSCE